VGLCPAQIVALHRPHLLAKHPQAECGCVGHSIKEVRFRTRFDAAVVAVHRQGTRIKAKVCGVPGESVARSCAAALAVAVLCPADRHCLLFVIGNSHSRGRCVALPLV
jgi:hypothetical protein